MPSLVIHLIVAFFSFGLPLGPIPTDVYVYPTMYFLNLRTQCHPFQNIPPSRVAGSWLALDFMEGPLVRVFEEGLVQNKSKTAPSWTSVSTRWVIRYFRVLER